MTQQEYDELVRRLFPEGFCPAQMVDIEEPE